MKNQKLKTLDYFSDESEQFETRFDQLLAGEYDESGRTRLVAEITEWMQECARQGRYIPLASAERRAYRSLLERWSSRLRDQGHYVEDIVSLADFDPNAGIVLTVDCPYPGLEPYAQDRRGCFFGREALVLKLVDHLEQQGHRILMIVGASGSGKSSLALAGVLPQLVERHDGAWLFGPRLTPGAHPMVELAAAIAQTIGRPEQAREIEHALAANPDDTSNQLAVLCQNKPLMLFIDQFEELLTMCRDSGEQCLFAQVLCALSEPTSSSNDFSCRILLTLRTDHLARFESNHALKQLHMRLVGEDNQHYLSAIGFEDIKRAIKGPAEEVGLRFIPVTLIDQLASETAGLSNGLPLLQFALRRLWDTRPRNESGKPLDLINAEMMKGLPDVERALGTLADSIFRTFSDSQKRVCERLLLELLVLDESFEEPLRRRRNEAELVQVLEAQFPSTGEVAGVDKVAGVIDSFVSAGLLRRFGDRPNGRLEVAHEALLRHWDHVYRIVTGAEVKERLHLIKQIGREASDWVGHDRLNDYLYLRGERLDRAIAYGADGWLAEAEAAVYVDACRAHVEEERLRDRLAIEEKERADLAQRSREEAELRAQRARRNTWGLALIALLIIGFLFIYGWQIHKERVAADQARAETNDLLVFLLGEQFLGEIRDVGRSTLLKQVRDKVQTYTNDRDQRYVLIRGLALRNSGDIARMQGHLKDSVDFFSKALTAIENSPEGSVRWQEAARTRERLGEALTDQGQVTQALTHYESAVNAWRQVARHPSVKTDDCTNLADSLVSLGNLKSRMGNASLALNDLNEAINITADVLIGRQTSLEGCGPAASKAEPYLDAKALEVLSRAIILRAYILGFQEDFDGAYPFANEATKLRPHSVSAVKNTLVALAWRGNGQRKPQRALDDYRQVLAGFEELRKRDPDNRLWQRERAATQLLIAKGIMACRPGECEKMPSLEEAEATVLEAIAALRELNEIDPSNVSLQSDLGWALMDHAKVLAAQGHKKERLQKIEEAERAYHKAQLDKADTSAIAEHGSLLAEKADALASLDRLPEAKEAVQKSIDLFNGLIAGNQDNLDFMRRLLEARQREADIRRKEGNQPGADAADREASKLTGQYNKKIGSLKRETDELYGKFVKQEFAGDKLSRGDDHAGALREFQAAESGAQKYIRHRPADFSGYRELSNIYNWIQLMQEKLGKKTESTAAFGTWMQAAQIAVLLAPACTEKEKKCAEQNKTVKTEMNTRLLDARYYYDIFLYQNSGGDRGKLENVLGMIQEEIAVAEGLVQEYPQDASHMFRLGDAKAGLGQVRRDLKMTGWEEVIRSGLIYIQKAAVTDPTKVAYLNRLGEWQKYLAEQYQADGHKETASVEYRHALEAYQKVARDFPGDEKVDDAIRQIEIALTELDVQ